MTETTTLAESSRPENAKTGEDVKQIEAVKYQFPSTLAANHPGRIVFSSYYIDPANVSQAFKDIFKKLPALSKPFPIRNDEQSQTTSDNQISEAERERILKNINAETQKLSSYNGYDIGQLQGSVTLPLFRGVRFSDKANYETANLGIIGAGIEGFLQGDSLKDGLTSDAKISGAAKGLVANLIASAAGTIAGGAVGSIGGKAGAVLGAVGGNSLFEGVGNAVKNATRVTVAPNKRTLFNDVGMRQFQFQFKMIASNEKEAREIKEIIKFFRKEMYPEAIAFTNGGLPFAYKFPNVFDIKILDREGKDAAFQIQRCYLESVDTTFNQTATGMFEGKYFIEVDVSLSFIEITALNKNKVEEGF